jgi:poly-gamma-glutamate synthesis protein (capsule biosynthesis protein)
MNSPGQLPSLVLACLILMTSPAGAEPVRLIFAGDIMLDDGPGKVIQSGRDPLAHFAATLAEADFAVGNLECPVATVGQPLESKIFSFRAHPRVLSILKGRFNALAVANNHSGDYGKEAFLETLTLLEQNHLPYFGGGRDLASAHAPLWIVRQGLRIALLGYNEFKPRSFEAGPDWAGIAWSEDSQVVADIRAARSAGADLVIPFMHWGWERELQPSQRQRQLARTMIDAGADIVIGGHPHVTQGAEYYRGKLIVYSLGNFIFDGFDPPEIPETREGWLLRLSVDRNGLIEWDTVAARMDQEGTPHPVSGALTPCGKAGETDVRMCKNP